MASWKVCERCERDNFSIAVAGHPSNFAIIIGDLRDGIDRFEIMEAALIFSRLGRSFVALKLINRNNYRVTRLRMGCGSIVEWNVIDF